MLSLVSKEVYKMKIQGKQRRKSNKVRQTNYELVGIRFNLNNEKERKVLGGLKRLCKLTDMKLSTSIKTMLCQDEFQETLEVLVALAENVVSKEN
jgi:CRISPR/Cas system CSM-associated protein Csm2 small subunit